MYCHVPFIFQISKCEYIIKITVKTKTTVYGIILKSICIYEWQTWEVVIGDVAVAGQD